MPPEGLIPKTTWSFALPCLLASPPPCLCPNHLWVRMYHRTLMRRWSLLPFAPERLLRLLTQPRDFESVAIKLMMDDLRSYDCIY